MNYIQKKKPQFGFTLIEALIAFLVLSVGIVGALLFHATLLSESANNKAKLEALSVAENWAESERNKTYLNAASFATAISTLNGFTSDAVGTLNTYTLSVNSVASVSTSTYKIDYSVAWSEGTLPLSIYLGWVDTSELQDPTEVDTGEGKDYDSNLLPLPTGSLSEIDRIQLASAAVVTGNLVDDASRSNVNDSIKIYTDTGDCDADGNCATKVAVEVGDGVFVNLAELSAPDNEVFTITGRVYLNNIDASAAEDTTYGVDQGFGPAYGVESTSNLDMAESSPTEGVDYYEVGESGSERYYQNNIVDIRASAGANCLITRYENFSSAITTKIDNTNYKVFRGKWGDFICVAGTGWNGTIKPYLRHYSADTLNDIVIGEQNCVPSVKAYRYLILNSEQPELLKTTFSSVLDLDQKTLDELLDDTDSTIVGQSGLVRFYDDVTEADASSEAVRWDQYFWHNPNYLVSPAQQSGVSFAYTSSIVGPETLIAGQPAFYGYKSPRVTVASAGSQSSYQLSYPGDIAHQNFYISGGIGGNPDCGDVLDNMLPKVTAYTSDIQTPSGGEFTHHSHLSKEGAPGYEVVETGKVRGYIPPVDGSDPVDVSIFNRELVAGEPENTGLVILGYTLATESLSGTLSYPSTVSTGWSQFVLGGGPSPVISINCNKDTANAVVSGAYTYVDYSCAVPNYWTGEIFAYDSDKQTATCLSLDYVADGDVANPSDITQSEIASVARPSVQYYYNQEIVSGSVSESEFNPLGFYPITSAAADLTDKDIYDFKFKFSESTCPPDL